MKKVYISAPMCGSTDEMLKKVKRYTEYALKCGTAPVVPHFYAMCLRENSEETQDIIHSASQGLLWFCDEMWVFGDSITHQMEKDIQFCKIMNIHYKFISDSDIRKILGGYKK